MKIIFLDVDGVLNSAEWDKKCCLSGGDLAMVDPRAVVRMVDVCKQTGAQIVLSSSWRFFPDFVEKLKGLGLPIIDTTPRKGAFGMRADEIRAWIGPVYQERGPFDFVIVDDEPDAGDGPDLADRFVQTNPRLGLTADDAAKIVGLFT